MDINKPGQEPPHAFDALENCSTRPGTQVSAKPAIIGLYGISGSGKSFLLKQLQQKLDPALFFLLEGSDKIASLVHGGLKAFHELDEEGKMHQRCQAIDAIKRESYDSGRSAIVTGHLALWESGSIQPIYTSNDLDAFTHIIYLDIPANVISQRRLNDDKRDRTGISPENLHQWQETEIAMMRELCRNHHILFSRVSDPSTLLQRVTELILHFSSHMMPKSNLARVHLKLDEVLSIHGHGNVQTALVLDGDKTLAAQDTGVLFWQKLAETQPYFGPQPLKDLFGSPLGYSDTAFHQATLLYEEATDNEQFESVCDAVAKQTVLHPELTYLLQRAKEQSHITVLVITCGLRRVWEKVLDRYGLLPTAKVIGGGRIADGFVVTAAVKAAVVSRLRRNANIYVWAFGDSPLDLPMLMEADQAIVVVGDKHDRSSTMDDALSNAVRNENFRPRQVLLPEQSLPRLDENRLPLVRLDDERFLDSIFLGLTKILHATGKDASKLLSSPTRDATIAGPALRKAHDLVGWYLATEFITQLIGLEEYAIAHVQGHQTTGFRLINEERTSIVALMRGGEAMAFGVNAAFPRAMFIHATSPSDLKAHHVDTQSTIILVDSVVNSGNTLMQFIERVRHLQADIRIVLVAGVVQAEVVMHTHPLATHMRRHRASLVALRLSENKFTGTKGTDTGNRLFNTTHLA
jgi:phosphoserine phosphatase/uracil phosphoribosyltransferase/adenylate kinase